MALNREELAAATQAILTELAAVDACGPHGWTPADQTRYLRLLIEQGLDEMARGDDALHDYMADCVMLAVQNMQDARLQMVEDRLSDLENPAGPTVKDLVIETAVMVGLELVLVAGAPVAVPALITFAAARSLARRTRALATAERRAVAHGDALGPLLSSLSTHRHALRLNREQAVRFPGRDTSRLELEAVMGVNDIAVKLQAARAAFATSEAAWVAADAAMERTSRGATTAASLSASIKGFFEHVVGEVVVARIGENVATDMTTLVTAHLPTEPPTSPTDGPTGEGRTFLTSAIAGRFLSEIRREQEEAAEDWRALRFHIRFLTDAALLSDETAQELYLRSRLFAVRSATTHSLMADREFLVRGMEAQLWLAWLRHTNSLSQGTEPVPFVVYPGFPPLGIDAGTVYEDKLVLEATFESDPDPEIGNYTSARGIVYPGLRVLDDGRADYLYHQFARRYFLLNPGQAPAPLEFDAARYDRVASMPERSPFGFEDMDRRARLGEMKLLAIVFFQKLAANPGAIADGTDVTGAEAARTLLRGLLDLDDGVDPAAEFLSLLPAQSDPAASAPSDERPVDAVLDALVLAIADPTTEARATASRLGAMVTDLDLAISQHPPPESFEDTTEGRFAKAAAEEHADAILELQQAVTTLEKEFYELAEDFPTIAEDFRRSYNTRIQQLTTWLPTGDFTGPLPID